MPVWLALSIGSLFVLAESARAMKTSVDGDPPGKVQSLEELTQAFFGASSRPAQEFVIDKILSLAPAFDDLFAALRRGRNYAKHASKGRILRERRGVDGLRHPYMILVPEDYTPSSSWPVRFDLHGGMGAKEWRKLDGAWSGGWTRAEGEIMVFPAGWWDSMWWEWSQAENFEAILRELRSEWNIDENRIVAFGNSDGGAALFFYAMRQPDRFAGYIGHVAPPDRLVRSNLRPDGQMHVSNLSGQRFLLGYGENDPKVPIVHLRKYMALFKEKGALIDWYVLPKQGHSLTLSDERIREMQAYSRNLRRDPLPDRLSWATERTDRYARRAWLVIDELEAADTETPVDDSILLPRWGTSIQLRGATSPRMPWGQVELERSGNRVVATSRHVKHFTLLLSPDEFDFSQPIQVELNGKLVHDARVSVSIRTLLKWAAVDDDRTLLFGAELRF